MKNLTSIKLFVLGILFTVSPKSFSTILITDNFNYTVAQPLATNNGWTSFILQTATEKSTAVSDIAVADETLSYPGYLSSNVGNVIQLDGLNKDVYRLFPHIAGTTTEAFNNSVSMGGRVTTENSSVYASMLVNVEQAPDGDVKGDCFFGFGSNNWGIGVAGRIYTKKLGNGFQFGVTRVGNGKIVWDATERSLNTTYLVVLKYTIIAGPVSPAIAGTDRTYLSINPVLGASEPTWIANDVTDANAELGNLVGAVQFLQQINTSYVTTKSKIKVGGLRVATTWAEVGELSQTNDIQANKTSALNVKVLNSNLYITTEVGKTIEIYNAVGKRIAQFRASNTETIIPISAKGLYVVKVCNEKMKVIL